MKIIDLLNKIANGEEVPKKIKYKDDIYEYYETSTSIDYRCYDEETILYGYLSSCIDYNNFKCLNDEVEIIEEEKKIPEKLEEFGIIQYKLDYIDYKNIEVLKEWLNKDFQTIYDTLDLIIKNQNKLIDYLKSKGDE